MRSSPEIFCTFLKALSDADVDLDLVDISETSVGAVTHADRLADAELAVRRAFGMAPSDEEAMADDEENLMPAGGPPLGTWAEITDQDTAPVPRGARTVARHF
jgi:aspartate kinase